MQVKEAQGGALGRSSNYWHQVNSGMEVYRQLVRRNPILSIVRSRPSMMMRGACIARKQRAQSIIQTILLRTKR